MAWPEHVASRMRGRSAGSTAGATPAHAVSATAAAGMASSVVTASPPSLPPAQHAAKRRQAAAAAPRQPQHATRRQRGMASHHTGHTVGNLRRPVSIVVLHGACAGSVGVIASVPGPAMAHVSLAAQGMAPSTRLWRLPACTPSCPARRSGGRRCLRTPECRLARHAHRHTTSGLPQGPSSALCSLDSGAGREPGAASGTGPPEVGGWEVLNTITYWPGRARGIGLCSPSPHPLPARSKS
jgi:hypothetical protein